MILGRPLLLISDFGAVGCSPPPLLGPAPPLTLLLFFFLLSFFGWLLKIMVSSTVINSRATCLVALFLSLCSTTRAVLRPNVLLIAVDDLRADFGSVYISPTGEHSFVQTPALDAMANMSGAVAFTSCFVQFSHCVVSRASILTSRRPAHTTARTGVPFGDGSCARGPGQSNYFTLPTYFR